MITEFVDWLKNPLKNTSGGPSAYTLFLFLGLVLVMLWGWRQIFQVFKM